MISSSVIPAVIKVLHLERSAFVPLQTDRDHGQTPAKLGCKDTHLFAKCITLEAFFNSSKTWDNRFVPRGSSLCAGATSVFEQC